MGSTKKPATPSSRHDSTAAEYAEQIKRELKTAWLPCIYRDRIRKMRTRSYRFDELNNRSKVEIHHTLLGVELKVGSRRMLCPDLATARYLAVFARTGCSEFAVPYDITRVSLLADELESSWHRMLLLADHHTANESDALRNKVGRILVKMISREVAEAGPGGSMPEFKQTTKQHK